MKIKMIKIDDVKTLPKDAASLVCEYIKPGQPGSGGGGLYVHPFWRDYHAPDTLTIKVKKK